MNRHNVLKSILIIQTLTLIIYTTYVVWLNGWNFLDIAIPNVKAMNWNGQFTLDFNCYLILSALWIMWRNRFKFFSIVIGIMSMILGIIFFAPYLLYLLVNENGNIKRMIVGDR